MITIIKRMCIVSQGVKTSSLKRKKKIKNHQLKRIIIMIKIMITII